MAIMIPDACPSKASTGEKKLFRLLQDVLPDALRVWYEPVVRGRYPDFTILSDNFGLLVLEVKGWYPKQIQRASDQEVELLITEGGQSYVQKVRNPVRQARDYMYSLMDLLKAQPLLRHATGKCEGRLCFPCGHGVLFSNLHFPERGLISV